MGCEICLITYLLFAVIIAALGCGAPTIVIMFFGSPAPQCWISSQPLQFMEFVAIEVTCKVHNQNGLFVIGLKLIVLSIITRPCDIKMDPFGLGILLYFCRTVSRDHVSFSMGHFKGYFFPGRAPLA